MDMIIQGSTCLLNYSVLMWQQVRNTDWSLHVLFPFVDCMTMMNRDRLSNSFIICYDSSTAIQRFNRSSK